MRIKKRFAALLIVLVTVFGGTFIYCVLTGNTCTVTMVNSGFGFDVNEKDFKVELSDPSVAEFKELRVVPNGGMGKTAEVTFHSLNQGEATATVFYIPSPEQMEDFDTMSEKDQKEMLAPRQLTPKLNLHVTPFGTMLVTNGLTFNGWELVQVEILGSTVLIAIVMLASFIESVKKGRFSYSTVAFGGVAMYFAFMFLLSVYDMQYMNTFRNFLNSISDSGYLFVFLTAPVMLLVAGLIAFSNIWLMRHEGRRPQNMLGIGLAVAWVLGLGSIMIIDTLLIGNGHPTVGRDVSYSLAYVLSFMECMLLSTIACTFLAARYKPPFDKDYLLILGCCIRDDGTLTPILKGRADAAISFEREQFAATGKHAKFVPSGGQGADEVISEAEAMKRYLLEQGYPEEQIVKEDKSVNTYQNIQFSRDRIKEDAKTLEGVRAAFATTNYHVFRGYVLSKKHKLDAQGISAKTKWYFYPNAFLREFAGLLVDKKFQIAAIVLMILILYTGGVHLLHMQF